LALGALIAVLPLLSASLVFSSPASAAPARGRLSGIDFATSPSNAVGKDAAEFQRIKADGANSVSFLVAWQVPSYSSSTATPGPYTDSDADLLAGAQEAHRAGLNVTMTPKVVIGVGGWQGTYNPPDPATFFADYQSMVEHYAVLAQQASASMYLVGSEMIASDGYVAYWRQIIAAAHQRFSGSIGYEVDWREISQFSWGDAVDVLLLSAYFPLSNEAQPTLAQLEWGWHAYQYPGQSEIHNAFSDVAGLARRWNKPIVFGEVGYTATTYPANQPWWNNPNPADPQLQYLAYRALLDTFVGQPWWGGVMWWAWNDGGPRSPENKPAESLIGAQSVATLIASGNAPSGGSPAPLPRTPVSIADGTRATGEPDPAMLIGPGAPGTAAGPISPGTLAASASPPDGTPRAAGDLRPARSGLVDLRREPAGTNGIAAALALGALLLGWAALLRLMGALGWPGLGIPRARIGMPQSSSAEMAATE
jgi:hypothetical protein